MFVDFGHHHPVGPANHRQSNPHKPNNVFYHAGDEGGLFYSIPFYLCTCIMYLVIVEKDRPQHVVGK